MLLLVLSAPSAWCAPIPMADAVMAELMAMPDNATRRALLVAKLQSSVDAAELALLAHLVAAVNRLDQAGVVDPVAVRAELQAVVEGQQASLAPTSADAAGPPGPPPPVPATAASAPASSGGRAKVCLGRPSPVGMAVPFSLSVNGETLGMLNGLEFKVIDVPAGQTLITLGAEQPVSTSIPTDVGTTTYLRVVPLLGAVIARATFEPLVATAEPTFVERCAKGKQARAR